MRIKNLFLFVFIILIGSCTTSALQNREEAYKFENFTTYIMRTNHFQFFLRDYTVWDAVNYAMNDEYGLLSKKLFTVSLRPTLKNIRNYYVLKDVLHKKNYSLEVIDMHENHANLYQALLKEGDTIICVFQRKAIFDDYSFVFEYDGRKYESFKADDFVRITNNDVVIAELHKKMNYFTSDLGLKLESLTEQPPLLLFVAYATLFDEIWLVENGRRFK